MKHRMKLVWVVLNVSLVSLVVGALIWLTNAPAQQTFRQSPAGGPASRPADSPIRIGLIPERDIFQQRRRYRTLADYLSRKLDRPVELETLTTYEVVLREFAEKKIDGAFLGSLVAVLAMDRLGAHVIAKPEMPDGASTYYGVLFVRDDSPVRKIEDIAGRSIAMVRTTTAGHVFPGCVLMRLKMLEGPNRPDIVWVGTHDDAVRLVMSGKVAVGAAKNLRLDAILRAHPEWKIRRLAHGQPVPNNALLLRKDVAAELGPALSQALLTMDADMKGRDALKAFGARRFAPCQAQEYAIVYGMTECILPAWKQIGVPGPAPRRPDGWPACSCSTEKPCYAVDY